MTSLLAELAEKHKIVPGSKFTYGTAGFRMKADLLDSIMFSVGVLAVLRSKSHGGQVLQIGKVNKSERLTGSE